MAQLKDLLVEGKSRFIDKIYASDQFISKVVQGTSPFLIDSSTLVSNLNADLVDGQHFNYSNTSNSPTYLWGTSSNGTNYLVSRASMHSGIADKIVTVTRSTDAWHYPTFVDSDNSTATEESLYTAGGLRFNPSTRAIAIGTTSTASGSGAIAAGTYATADGTNAVAIGGYVTAIGSGTFARGTFVSAAHGNGISTAFGSNWAWNVNLTGDANATSYTCTPAADSGMAELLAKFWSTHSGSIKNAFILGGRIYDAALADVTITNMAYSSGTLTFTFSRTLSATAISNKTYYIICCIAGGEGSFINTGFTGQGAKWSLAGGRFSMALGDYGAISYGHLNIAGGGSSAAFGNHTLTYNNGEFACGSYNKSTSGSTKFSVGIGSADNARKNAFEIVSNGNAFLNGVFTINAPAYSANATWTYPGGSYASVASPNIRLIGDSTYGLSTIEFISQKGETSINKPSDCAFIQFQPYGTTTQSAVGSQPTLASSGELNRLVIGVNNDATDTLVLQTPSTTGLKHAVGTGLYTIWDSGNDGSGSGLDADLLDGKHASDFSLAHSHPYLPLAGGTMTGTIGWAGATKEILKFANNNATWYSGLKYSWSGNTTIALWGKHNMTQFVWHAGTDFTSTDVNGTSTRNYDFQVGRDASSKLQVRTTGQYVTTVAQGTAPLKVDSSTLVSNLNADLLDGKHASDFAISTHNHDSSYVKKAGDTMNSGGQLIVGTITNSSGQVYSGGIQLRELTYSTTSLTDNYENAPGITFHWGGRWVHKLNLHTNDLYWDNSKVWHASNDSSGSGLDADMLDGYHLYNLYTSIGDWIVKVGNTKTIVVDGDASTYYPVKIPSTTEKYSINYISVWKNLGTKTGNYPGNHTSTGTEYPNGSCSCWYIFEGRNNYWDGNGGYYATHRAWYGYAPVMSHAQGAGNGVGNLIVWLRGGGTSYNISCTYPMTDPSIYYEETNIGSSSYPVNVAPRTDIGNAGKIGMDYYGGTFYGNATTASSAAALSTTYYWADVAISTSKNYTATPYTRYMLFRNSANTDAAGYIGRGGSDNTLYFNAYNNGMVSVNQLIYADGSTNKVGIGTNTPTTKLDINGIASIYPRGNDNTAFKGNLIIKQQNSSEGANDSWDTGKPSFGIQFNRFWTSSGNPYGETICAGIFATVSSSWRGGLVFRTKNNQTQGGTHDITALRLYPSGIAELHGRTDTANYGYSSPIPANSALQIREYNYGGAQTDTWGYAPRMSWLWNGRNVNAQIGLASNGYLYWSNDNFATNKYKLMYESGTWGISITGNAATANSAGYASYLKGPDNRSTDNAPSWYMTNRGSASLYGEFCLSGGAVSSTYEYRMTMTPWGDQSGQRPVQMAFNNSGAFIRTSLSDASWNSWNTIIDSSNYTLYTVTKTGGGASGTWGISISGNSLRSASITTQSAARIIYCKIASFSYGNAGMLLVDIGGNCLVDRVYINYGSGNTTAPVVCGWKDSNSGYVDCIYTVKGSSWNSSWELWIKINQQTTANINVYQYWGACTVNTAADWSATTTEPSYYSKYEVTRGMFGDMTSLSFISSSTANYVDSAKGRKHSFTVYALTGSAPTPVSGTGPSTGDGFFMVFNYGDSYVTQIAIDLDPTYKLAIRHWKNDASTWRAWKNILTSNDTYVSDGYGTIGGTTITKVSYADSVGSHTHPINQITWAGGLNLTPTATANGQEWSIDLSPGSYTGTYWHVWSTPNSKSIFRCWPDNNYADVPNGNFAVGTSANSSYRLDVSGNTRIVYNTTSNNTPILTLSNSSFAGTNYCWATSSLASAMVANSKYIHIIGKASSTCNQAYFGYHHIADGCTNNFATIGLYAKDELVNILANGSVGIGTTAPTQKLHVVGSGKFEGGIGSKGTNGNATGSYIAHPGGGVYATSTSSVTGYLKITLPQKGKNTMMSFDVTIYTYDGANQSYTTYHISGYEYSTNGWYNPVTKVYSEGIGPYTNLTVRLGNDGTYSCVTIGEANTVWSYPQVTVHNIMTGYSNCGVDTWIGGWAVGFTTTALTTVVSEKTAVNTQNINVSGSAGSVAWGNITGKPSSFTPADHNHDGRYLQYNGWWTSGNGNNADTANGMVFAYANHNVPTGWGILTTFDYQYNSSYKMQLFSYGYTNGYTYYRNRSADRNGWNAWVRFLDSTNYTEYLTDTKVTQTVTGSSNTSWRPLIIGASYSDATTFSPSTVTDTTYATHLAKFKPSTGQLALGGLYKMNTNGTVATGANDEVWNTNGTTVKISTLFTTEPEYLTMEVKNATSPSTPITEYVGVTITNKFTNETIYDGIVYQNTHLVPGTTTYTTNPIEIPPGIEYVVSCSYITGYASPDPGIFLSIPGYSRILNLNFIPVRVDILSIDFTKGDAPSAFLTYTPASGTSVVQWIRNNSHRYAAYFAKLTSNVTDGNNAILSPRGAQMYICQLKDSDSTRFANDNSYLYPTDASVENGDIYMRLPKFYYRVTGNSTTFTVEFADVNPNQPGFQEWDSNNMIAVYPSSYRTGILMNNSSSTKIDAYISSPYFENSTISSNDICLNVSSCKLSSATISSSGTTVDKFAGGLDKASIKNMYPNIDVKFLRYKWVQILRLLFMAYYQTTDCVSVCGTGRRSGVYTPSAQGTQGRGMTDTTSSTGNDKPVNFWGVEALWGISSIYSDVAWQYYHLNSNASNVNKLGLLADNVPIPDLLSSGDVVYKFGSVPSSSDLYYGRTVSILPGTPTTTEQKLTYSPVGFSYNTGGSATSRWFSSYNLNTAMSTGYTYNGFVLYGANSLFQEGAYRTAASGFARICYYGPIQEVYSPTVFYNSIKPNSAIYRRLRGNTAIPAG